MKIDQLRNLADLIDHEQIWARARADDHELTPDQINRYKAGVELRRMAKACEDLQLDGSTALISFALAVRYAQTQYPGIKA